MPSNYMQPAAGAFATQEMPVPTRPTMAAPGPQMAPQGDMGGGSDLSALMAKLAAMGLLGGPGEVGSQPSMAAPPPMATAVQQPDPFSELESLMAKMPASEMPTRPTRKSVFRPGAPGQPKSGMSAHQILNDPDMVSTLQQRLSTWEEANPGKKLMGSHIQQMLPEVSAAQARTIKRLLDKALNKNAAVDMSAMIGRGAAKTMKG
jgi:hypothetical protein